VIGEVHIHMHKSNNLRTIDPSIHSIHLTLLERQEVACFADNNCGAKESLKFALTVKGRARVGSFQKKLYLYSPCSRPAPKGRPSARLLLPNKGCLFGAPATHTSAAGSLQKHTLPDYRHHASDLHLLRLLAPVAGREHQRAPRPEDQRCRPAQVRQR
jgi:hypothetical protein